MNNSINRRETLKGCAAVAGALVLGTVAVVAAKALPVATDKVVADDPLSGDRIEELWNQLGEKNKAMVQDVIDQTLAIPEGEARTQFLNDACARIKGGTF